VWDESRSPDNQTGGFELLALDGSEPRSIVYRVKEHGGETRAIGRMVVSAGNASFGIDAATRNRVIDGSPASGATSAS
jgi:hypothetical protein